ncbi:MAG TPA: chemotaxis response regulator protein-glutamate methylesterase [Rhizobiales bacterium]|nr:chemotaxis response regulator protein-glutamate methylesterase [Hyphomicrobiales bacterium]
MIVDDSVVIRGLLSRWLKESPGIEVAAACRNGKVAVEQVERIDPDIVVLDIEMPEMDGMTALPLLLEKKPGLKVIMASTLTKRNAGISLKALSLGAVDYIPKPEGNHGVTTSMDFRRDLIAKITAIGQARSRLAPKPALARPAKPAAMRKTGAVSLHEADATVKLVPFSSVKPAVLAIGSSTGGPQALTRLFTAISPALDRVPTVVTQHMPATFTAILADNLAAATRRSCKEAEDGEVLRAGVIYVAPGGKHLILKKEAGSVSARLDDGPPVNFCKPAVDPMFESLAVAYGGAVLGAILTGMGHDGRDGGGAIRKAGGSIIAQDEASSVVWGMPGAAAQAGICSAVLPIDQIANKIIEILKRG